MKRQPLRPVGGPAQPSYRPGEWSDTTITRGVRTFTRRAAHLEHLFHEIRCGLHSNIPPCCVAWFVLVWRDRSNGVLADVYRQLLKTRQRRAFYIACPKCLLTGRVQTLLTCGCQRYQRPYPWLAPDYLEDR